MKKFNPWWFTGYVDGDGTFSFSLTKELRVRLTFAIIAKNDPHNIALFEDLREHFGDIGYITFRDQTVEKTFRWSINSPHEQVTIRDHFLKYPQQTSKYRNFQVWCKVLDIVQAGEHLTKKGMETIVSYRAQTKRGVSPSNTQAFPNVSPAAELVFVPSSEPLDPDWIAGFVNAEGNFFQYVAKRAGKETYKVTPTFSISQHNKDIVVLERIKESFQLGSISHRQATNVNEQRISGITNMTSTILPFFAKHPVQGVKALDFQDFFKGCEIINSREHLTPAGIKVLQDIIARMNSKRLL